MKHFTTTALVLALVVCPACVVKEGPEGPAGAAGDAGPAGEGADPGAVAQLILDDSALRGALIEALRNDPAFKDAVRGPKGDPGESPTVDYAALSAGLVGSVALREAVIDALKNDGQFTLQLKGEAGAPGAAGPPGPNGPQGIPGEAGQAGQDANPVGRVVSVADGAELGLFGGGSVFDDYQLLLREVEIAPEDVRSLAIPYRLSDGFVGGSVWYQSPNCLGLAYVTIGGGYAQGGAQGVLTAADEEGVGAQVQSRADGINNCQNIGVEALEGFLAIPVPVESYPLPPGRVVIR